MGNRIESWIQENLPCVRTTSASSYDRMPLQSGGALVEIYQQPDSTKIGHWIDTALCAAFVEAVNVPGGTVLDVGPGDGWPSLIIASSFAKVVGIDPSSTRVGVQRENAVRMGKGNCEFVQMDVNRVEFEDATFDGVVAAASIEQSPDPTQALREIWRVLKPGACLAMTFENYDHHGPEGEVSEEVELEQSAEERRLVYRYCTRTTPREAQYTLFLSSELRGTDQRLASELKAIQSQGPDWLVSHDLIGLLTGLKRAIIRCEYYELSHLTVASLDRELRNIGYANIRGFDSTIGGLRPFVRTALETGKAGLLRDTFMEISRIFGITCVRNSTARASDFTIAQKPLHG
jgi:ubiquinone/menaquinone biosynthesis C-methylase UbiE